MTLDSLKVDLLDDFVMPSSNSFSSSMTGGLFLVLKPKVSFPDFWFGFMKW